MKKLLISITIPLFCLFTGGAFLLFTTGAFLPSKGGAVIFTGQIEAISVPNGWVARKAVSLPTGVGLIEYHPVGHNDIRLNSYYRGMRIGAEAALAFKDSLAQPPHALKSAELKALSMVLRDKSYDFEIIFARTEDLNGRRVLSVEGTYKDPAHTRSRTIYVDSDHTGSVVQEISYTASSKDYQNHLTEAETALKSIIWTVEVPTLNEPFKTHDHQFH